jgi:hypothetical protein
MIPIDKLEAISMAKIEKSMVDTEFSYYETFDYINMAFWLRAVTRFDSTKKWAASDFVSFMAQMLYDFEQEIKQAIPNSHLLDNTLTDLYDLVENENILKMYDFCMKAKEKTETFFKED